jgi:hypothetical protein
MRDDDPVEAVSTLEPDVEPPAVVEERILRRLKADGSIRRSPEWGRPLAAAAVLIAAFAAGWMTARVDQRRSPEGDRYVLLLYGEVNAPEAELVAEYGAWARSARAGGRQLTGERLDSQAIVLGGGEADAPAQVHGYFVFTAASPADARTTAESHPHLRRGGRVVLRRILPT